MIPGQLGMQGNAAMYSKAHVWMQTFDCCCTQQRTVDDVTLIYIEIPIVALATEVVAAFVAK